MNNRKPNVFIASSTGGLPVAHGVKSLLKDHANVYLWKDHGFAPGEVPLDALRRICDKCDFALIVLTPDDILEDGRPVPRDNVTFEAGLFMGQLGRSRAFFLFDPNQGLKQATDFAGITGLTYSHEAFLSEPSGALEESVKSVRMALANALYHEYGSVLKSVVRLTAPHVAPSYSYSRIISDNLHAIQVELAHFEANEDWRMLLEAKARLYDYFEYSGQYRRGVDCGEIIARGLTKAGELSEAVWVRVKLVGYLCILAGDYSKGRAELTLVLSDLGRRRDEQSKTIRFYCLRYIGISYQRDVVPNKAEAKRYFEDAREIVKAMRPGRERSEVQARVIANLGNLHFDNRDYSAALSLYRESLGQFKAIGDDEHVAISHLQIGQTIIGANGDPREAATHLNEADGLVLKLGYVELQGRIAEQRALLNESQANRATYPETRRELLEFALDHAKRAEALFRQIDSQRRLGAAQALVDRLSVLCRM